jgi:hypothetical protein
LEAGTYTVEATAPGFARGTRLGVQVGGASTPDISITLNVDSISQSITIQDSVLVAVEASPQGNTLDTLSAQTEISHPVITNFMAPVADLPKSSSRRQAPLVSARTASDLDRASHSFADSRTGNIP